MSCGNSRSSKCNPCGPSEAAMNEIANRANYYARVAQNAYDGFSQVYLGAKDVAPTPTIENPLIVGALYFNTVSDILFVWDGSNWLSIYDNEIYLGGFADAPLLNNQGLPLQSGNLYWNTGSNNLWAYNGTTWIRTNFNETTPFLSSGSTTARTLATRFAEVRNVLDFGATGNGATDDTIAIQDAITAAGAGGTIYFPKGVYLLTATLNGLTNQNFVGDGPNVSILQRQADYGDTLTFVNIGSGSVRNLWFRHSTLPLSGFTTLDNKATSGAHLHIQNGQGAVIEDCWFWRMPYQIKIDRGSLMHINRCSAQGCWSLFDGAPAQEGIVGMYLGAGLSAGSFIVDEEYTITSLGTTTNTQWNTIAGTTGLTYAVGSTFTAATTGASSGNGTVAGTVTIIEITNCYMAGSNSGPQSITFTTSDRTSIYNAPGTNAGNLYGILVNSCESLVVDNCYIGGNSRNNIRISPNAISSQIRISKNMFDSAHYLEPCVYFVSSAVGSWANGVTISNNTFNSQLYGLQNIASVNTIGGGSTQAAIANFAIVGNSFCNTIGSSLFLRNAVNGTIGSNQISAYNARQFSFGEDVNYCNAILLINCTNVSCDGNIIGGAVNSGLVGGYTYRGIEFLGTINNLAERNTVHVGTGTSVNIIGKSDRYVVSTSINYTCSGVEDLVLVDTTAASRVVILPANPPKGMTITVKDFTGKFATNSCTIMGTIDNGTNVVMNINYMSRTVTYNGTDWDITGGYN